MFRYTKLDFLNILLENLLIISFGKLANKTETNDHRLYTV